MKLNVQRLASPTRSTIGSQSATANSTQKETRAAMLIDQLAKITGVSLKILRQYESVGLLVPIDGEEGDKQYHHSHIHAIKMIKLAQSVGFSLREIITVLNGQALANENKIDEALRILEQRREEINSESQDSQRQLQIIEILKRELEGFLQTS